MKQRIGITILLILFKGIYGQTPVIIEPIISTPKVSEINFVQSEMNGVMSKELIMRDIGIIPLHLFGATRHQITKSELVCELRIGDENILSQIGYIGKVSFTIKGLRGTSGNTILFQENRQLTLGSDTALSSYRRDITSIFSTMTRIQISNVQLTLNSQITPALNQNLYSYITNNIKFKCYFTEAVKVVPGSDINPSPVLAAPVINSDSSVTFSWGYMGADPFSYQIQVLRLYNHKTSYINSATHCVDELDWSKALTVETKGSARNITLTLAEGSGFYIWRVRSIMSNYDGDIGNSLNWGPWSGTGTYSEGAYNDFAINASDKFLFAYRQFDEHRNWIYSRIFAEGDVDRTGEPLIKEQMTYANGLQQVKQEQVLLNSDNKVMVSQTIYDYNGRPAMKTLPAPVNNSNGNRFKYMEKLVTKTGGVLYKAADFDANNTYKNPTPFDSATATSKIAKYYSSISGEANVPTAWGHPYTRTLFEVDGGNEARETSMPGYTHRIGGGHTTRVGEMSASNAELLRMFGYEAPNGSKVKKMITTDANNFSSVSYIDQDNKTIATCLIGNESNQKLDTATGYYQGAFDNLDTITKTSTIIPNSNKIQSSKKIYTPFPTSIILDYSFNAEAEYGSACLQPAFCKTCDYFVKITVTALDDSVRTIYSHTQLMPSQDCGDPASDNFRTEVELPSEGNYQVDRVLYTQNELPTAAPQTYYSTNRSSYQTQLWNSITDDLNPLFSALGEKDLTGFNYLVNQLPYGIEQGDTVFDFRRM